MGGMRRKRRRPGSFSWGWRRWAAGGPTRGGGRPGGVARAGEGRAYLQASMEERGKQEVAERERQAHELELQKRAASRLRGLLAGAVAFLLVAIGLSLFAFD